MRSIIYCALLHWKMSPNKQPYKHRWWWQEICINLSIWSFDTLIMQLEVGFGDFKVSSLLSWRIQVTSLLTKSFSSTKLDSRINKYHCFNKKERKWTDKHLLWFGKHLFPQKLFHYIVFNDSKPVNVKVSKLVHLVVTFPVQK